MTHKSAGIEGLSTRQREVLELVAKGLTNDEIAGVLKIAPTTVRTHMSQVLARLDLSNRTEATAAYVAWAARPEKIAVVLERPALAVLPIEAFDDAPVTRAAAWGLSHDLAALFARWCWFPVIAPAAVVGAPAPGETAQSVGQRLGARFLVTAALQTTTGCWRLNVRIIEAESGHWVWSDRYEFHPAEIFAIQDTVCATIVANAYQVLVAHTEVALRGRLGAADLTAWELAHHGMRLQASRDADANVMARSRFHAAIERDPGLVLAHFGLGLCGFDDVLNQRRPREEAMELLYACAQRCVGLAPHAAEGYFLLGRHAQSMGQHDVAALMLETSIARNPSFAAGHAVLAQVLQLAGRSDEALSRMRDAARLDGRSFVAGFATLLFARGDYTQALAAAEQAVSSAPRYVYARVIAAASAWWANDRPRAVGHIEALRGLAPTFTIGRFLQTFGADTEAVMRVSEALKAVGAAD